MNKTKVMSFAPGDNVDIHIKAKFTKFTILRIEAIEVNETFNDEVYVEL